MRALVPILVLAVAVTAGCGSKSPKEQFAAKLNAMCGDFAAREQQIGEPRTQEDLAARGDRIVTAFEQAIVEPLQQLKAPAEVAPQAARRPGRSRTTSKRTPARASLPPCAATTSPPSAAR